MTKRPDLHACDERSERAAIGAVLSDGSIWPDLAQALRRDDIYLERHKIIYDGCAELQARHESIDVVTMAHVLNGRLDSIGGMPYLSELIIDCPIPWNWPSYISPIIEAAAERRRAAALLEASRAIDAGDWQEAGRVLIESAECKDGTHPARSFRFFQAQQAFEQLAPVDDVVEGLVRAGVPSALVGKEKSGKSYIALDLAVCAAAGLPWLGRKTKRCGVACLDEENSESDMRRRVMATLRGHDLEGYDLPLFVLPMPRINYGALIDRSALIDFIRAHDIGLCIGDSFIDSLTLAGAKEKDADDQQRVLMAIEDICAVTGAAFLLLHHENRSGEYRGSSALPGAIDSMLTVKNVGGFLSFELALTRSGQPCEFSARMNFGAGTFNLSPAEVEADEAPHLSKSQEYVMRFLQQYGPSKIKDIIAAADTCTAEAARRAVYSLTALGRLCRVNPGEAGDAIYDRVGVNLNAV